MTRKRKGNDMNNKPHDRDPNWQGSRVGKWHDGREFITSQRSLDMQSAYHYCLAILNLRDKHDDSAIDSVRTYRDAQRALQRAADLVALHDGEPYCVTLRGWDSLERQAETMLAYITETCVEHNIDPDAGVHFIEQQRKEHAMNIKSFASFLNLCCAVAYEGCSGFIVSAYRQRYTYGAR